VQQVGALGRGHVAPAARGGPRRRDRRLDLLERGGPDLGDRLLGRRVLDRDPVAVALDLLTRDQKPSLHRQATIDPALGREGPASNP
jgi:hypothetical protein